MPRGRRGGIFTVARNVPRGQVRDSSWFGSADSTGDVLLGAGLAVLDQSFPQATLQALYPFTIIRTRGVVSVRSDQEATSENPFGAVGFAVVSEQARVAGVLSIPAPITHEASDLFFVHQFFFASISVGSAVGFQNVRVQYPFDSRAMRKVEEGEAIVVVLENASALDGVAYQLKFRMLVKLN